MNAMHIDTAMEIIYANLDTEINRENIHNFEHSKGFEMNESDIRKAAEMGVLSFQRANADGGFLAYYGVLYGVDKHGSTNIYDIEVEGFGDMVTFRKTMPGG